MLIDDLKKYIGQEVLVTETKFTDSIGQKEYEIVECEASKKDTVLKELESAIKKVGFQMRVWFPGTIGTMELRNDRVNVTIVKKDNKYEIVNVYIG